MPIHGTEEFIVKSTLVEFNRMNKAGFVDANVAAITNGNIAGLKSDIEGLATLHETERNFARHCSNMISKMSAMKKGAVAAPGVVTPTDVTTGGALLPNVTYNFKYTAIDIDGNESAASAVFSLITANDGNSTHRYTFSALTTVVGAESYRLYRKKSTDTDYSGYLPVTKANAEAGGTAFYSGTTGEVIIGTATPPTTGTAQIGVLTNVEVAAAKSTGTFASLLSKITADSSEVGTQFASDIYYGGQPIA